MNVIPLFPTANTEISEAAKKLFEVMQKTDKKMAELKAKAYALLDAE
jgi:hypothetical protein